MRQARHGCAVVERVRGVAVRQDSRRVNRREVRLNQEVTPIHAGIDHTYGRSVLTGPLDTVDCLRKPFILFNSRQISEPRAARAGLPDFGEGIQ